MARSRDNHALYLRRDQQAKAQGWTGYAQKRYWVPRLTDAYVMELAEDIGGAVEPERDGSLMSLEANAKVNPRDRSRVPSDWRVRLLVAAGKIPGRPYGVTAG